jgi:hypothetical protein
MPRDHTESESRPVTTKTHIYREMAPEMRPQDPTLDGKGWTFQLLEHGGDYPDAMPQAICAADAAGRTCIYVPVREDGWIVESLGFEMKRERDSY